MKIISVQEAYTRKFSRQAAIPGVELHSGGLCAHRGKISPGCYWCFSPLDFSWGVHLGADVLLPNICNLGCPYCISHGDHLISSRSDRFIPPNWRLPGHFKEAILSRLSAAGANLTTADLPSFAFAGDGAEPLLYLPVIREYMKFYRQEVEKLTGRRNWYKLYTNGLLASAEVLLEMQDLGFTEIRFHLGASNFSPRVYRHLGLAARLLPTATVETPAWPPHRRRLLKMLPLIADLGVKHLNLIEVAVTGFNFKNLARILPEAQVYHSSFGLALDDGGLAYEIMEEVYRRGYPFSVLDCNSLVRKVRDERSFARYFRQSLRLAGYGDDWATHGTVVGAGEAGGPDIPE